MGYRVEVSLRADSQLAELDATVGASIERKILWLAENASGMVHRRLVGMPEDLAGLCKLRIATGESSIGSITQNKLFASIAFNIAPKFIESFETLKRRAKRTADGIPPTPHCRARASLAIPWSTSRRSAFLEPKVCFGKLPKLTG